MSLEQRPSPAQVGMFDSGLVESRAHLARTNSNGICESFQRFEDVGLTPKRRRHGFNADSKMILRDILDWPWRRSTKVIGNSTIRRPARSARKTVSTKKA